MRRRAAMVKAAADHTAAGRARLLTIAEVATRLGLQDTPRTVYALDIPRTELSPRRTRWHEQDVEAYIASKRMTPTERKSVFARRTSTTLTAGEPDLLAAFRRAGVVVKK